MLGRTYRRSWPNSAIASTRCCSNSTMATSGFTMRCGPMEREGESRSASTSRTDRPARWPTSRFSISGSSRSSISLGRRSSWSDGPPRGVISSSPSSLGGLTGASRKRWPVASRPRSRPCSRWSRRQRYRPRNETTSPAAAAAGDVVPRDETRVMSDYSLGSWWQGDGSLRSRWQGVGGTFFLTPYHPRLSVQAGETAVVALVDGVPVNGVPPSVEILRTAVLVLEVVGVLPDVVAEYRKAGRLDDPGHQGVVLVRRGDDGELAVRADNYPDPAGAEPAHAGLVELGFQCVEPTKGVVDRLGDLTLRCSTAARAHDLPEHGVVVVATAVVADRRPLVVGHHVQVAHELVNAHVGERCAFSRRIE